MTTLDTPPRATLDAAVPLRRTLVGLAVGWVALVVAGLALAKDPDDVVAPAKVVAQFDTSDAMTLVLLAIGIVSGGVLVFLGAALKAALEVRTRSWTTAVVGHAFTLGGVMLLLTSLAGLWLKHAVDLGQADVVRVFTIIDVENFPAMMLFYVTAYVGVGVAAWSGRSLPRWLAAASIVIGVLAPLGPGGYLAFALSPIWLVLVAAMVRLSEE